MVFRLADDNIRGISIDDGFCDLCQNVADDGITCAAFPDGIPIEVLNGEIDHRNFVKGDNGIKFQGIEGIIE